MSSYAKDIVSKFKEAEELERQKKIQKLASGAIKGECIEY